MKRFGIVLVALALAACGGPKHQTGGGYTTNGYPASGQITDYRGKWIEYEFIVPQQYICSTGKVLEFSNKEALQEVMVSCYDGRFGTLVLTEQPRSTDVVGRWTLNTGESGSVLFKHYNF